MGHWIVNVSKRQRTLDCKKKHQHLQTAGKDHKLGKRDGVGLLQKGRETAGQKERERGREDALLYEKGG